jgi:hypothetical protein
MTSRLAYNEKQEINLNDDSICIWFEATVPSQNDKALIKGSRTFQHLACHHCMHCMGWKNSLLGGDDVLLVWKREGMPWGGY